MALKRINPETLTVYTEVDGTKWDLIYDDTNGIIGRVLVGSSRGNFIVIGQDVFSWVRGYQGAIKNTGSTMLSNDFIADGITIIDSIPIYIDKAKYNGGNITDFGTYDPVTGDFTGGNYTIINAYPI